jgi:putative SOS response-associated peptidase YedK
MCGRFALFASGDEVAKRFQLSETPLFEPRYNIAPTQAIPAVRPMESLCNLRQFRWGLISSWASEPKIAYKLINARAETVADTPYDQFKKALHQQCLNHVRRLRSQWRESRTGAAVGGTADRVHRSPRPV